MTKLEKRFLSFTLTVVMVISTMFSFDFTVKAESNEVIESNVEEGEETVAADLDGKEVADNQTVDVNAVEEETPIEEATEEVLAEEVVEEASASAQAGTENYKYNVVGINEISITKYIGADQNVEIPKQLDGKKVTTIGKLAFADTNVVNVEIPNTVTNIQYCAFASIDGLNKVSFENNSKLKKIEDEAFGRSTLSEIVIPNGVEEIGKAAFVNTNIQSIVLPDSVKKIGEYCFAYTKSLNDAHLGNGINVIEDGLFGNSGLKNVNIPTSVTRIGMYAFVDTNLEEIIIPNTVMNMGGGTFEYCRKLKKVTLGERLISIPWKCFLNTAVESITIPKSVKRIEEQAFENTKLKEIVIPDTVIEMEFGAFNECKMLSKVVISNALTYVAHNAFSGTAVKDVTIGNKVKTLECYSFKDCKELTAIDIPDSVTRIEYGVFRGDTKLENIKFPKNLEMIEEQALTGTKWFANQSNNNPVYVQNIFYNFKGTVPKPGKVKVRANTIGISGEAFMNQQNLTELVIPDTVKEIGRAAACNCTNLKKVYIPESVTKIGKHAFGYVYKNSFDITKIDGFEIHGEPGSVAQQYATENNIKFVEANWNNVTYDWKKVSGKWQCTATAVNEMNPDIKKTVSAKVTSVVTKNPTLKVDGEALFTAKFPVPWAKDQTKTDVLSKVNLEDSKGLVAQPYGTNKVLLTWKKSENADGYIICGKTATGEYHQIGNTKNLRYVHTKAAIEEYNFYWVFPYKKYDNGVMVTSNCTKYVYAKGKCATVKNLKASSRKNGVNLAWDKVQNADGYLIYGMENGGKYHYIGMTKNQANKVSYLDTKAVKGVYNFYWVYAYEEDENGKMVVGETANYVYGSVLK